jgi:hypothetical protein
MILNNHGGVSNSIALRKKLSHFLNVQIILTFMQVTVHHCIFSFMASPVVFEYFCLLRIIQKAFYVLVKQMHTFTFSGGGGSYFKMMADIYCRHLFYTCIYTHN